MQQKNRLRFATRQIHGGLHPGDAGNARGLAIVPTAAYRFPTCGYAADLFELSQPGNIYTRLQNPTTSSYEERIASLYGGTGAVATPSGMSAIFIVISALAQAGDNIVTSPFLYGGTYNLFRHSLRKLGIEVRIAPDEAPSTIASLCDGHTKAIFIETLGNPNSNIIDIEAVAEAAHRNGIPLIVDNTFATPYLVRPIELGADIVVHSATKFLGGHGTSLGGVIVDSGRFDWKASGKFPQLTEPEPSYHGVRFIDAAGAAAFVTRVRAVLLRDTGATISPFNAFLLLQGVETLSLRVERHSENARKVVEYLASHPKVKRVNHPMLAGHPDHELYKRYFPEGGGSIFTFELDGGKEAAHRFIDSLEIFSLLANVADAKSLVIHPASTTHSQLNEEQLAEQGITPGTVRVSIGTEHADDLIADIAQALEQV